MEATVVQQRSEGAELLEQWLRSTKTTLAAVGKAVGKTHVAIIKWKSGEFRPESDARAILEKITGGAVPAVSWLSAEERAAIEAAQPMVPAETPVQP